MQKRHNHRMGRGIITAALMLTGAIFGASCGESNPTCDALFADWESKVLAWDANRDNPELGCPALQATLGLIDSNCLTEAQWQDITGMSSADYRQLTLDAIERLECDADPEDELAGD